MLRFADGRDPVEAIVARAREIVVSAIDDGWPGPPFDPLTLAADFLRLTVTANADIPDARTLNAGRERLRIEFNPNRPRGRMRYSLAHEIAHTLFADCGERVRNRGSHEAQLPDDWQLEALCNIAAAEFLMPVGSFPVLKASEMSIENLMRIRKDFDVSAESLLLRAVQVAEEPCAMFCASRVDETARAGRYRIDYAVGSPAWDATPATGELLPSTSVVSQCERVGYTAIGDESWTGTKAHLECVGIPSYPGSAYPRIVGLISGARARNAGPRITYLRGSATKPRGTRPKIIVHAVNDSTPNWGGRGFAMALMKAFPQAQDDFRAWVQRTPGALRLGSARVAELGDETYVASIVVQRGYGPSVRPRIRYGAMQQALDKVAAVALEKHATVHMPRIGCGQAGGSWDVVYEIVSAALCAKGIDVSVYDLPNADDPRQQAQTALSFSTRN